MIRPGKNRQGGFEADGVSQERAKDIPGGFYAAIARKFGLPCPKLGQ